MNHRHCKLVFLLFILSGCTNHLYHHKDQIDWPIKVQSPWNTKFLVAKSIVVSDKNDTIAGAIRTTYFRNNNHIELLPHGKEMQSDVIEVNPTNTKYLRIYTDSNKNQFDDFESIEWQYKHVWHSGFLRIIAKKNKIGIYDSYGGLTDGTFGGVLYNDKLILVNNNQTISICSSTCYMFHQNNRIALFLNFINKHYQQHFKKEDFKDEKAMIDYILNKENETLENKKQ